MKRKFSLLSIVLAFMVGVSGTFVGVKAFTPKYSLSSDSGGTDVGNLAKVQQVYDLINSKYVQKIDQKKLIDGAIQGMVSVLDDPFSAYMDKDAAQQFQQSLDSSFQGIGAEVHVADGKLIVVSPIKDSPADKAGLRPNDEIVSVNGDSVKGLSQTDAVMKIRGKKGTEAKLVVKRANVESELTFDIIRDDIPMLTVFGSVKESKGKKIGYIQITSFSEGTAAEFTKKLEELEKDKVEGLVLDVRGNPGGYLQSVEEMLNLLVTDAKPIVQIEDRNGNKKGTKSTLKKKKDYPISVLTDGGTASAAEILAAALHEGEDYPIVGEKSFGKGTVQQPIPMEDGSNLKLTQFKWLTPNGNWIHKKGIEPTVAVKQPSYFYVSPIQFKDELKYNMNDEQIKNAQIMLKGLGFEPGREDGYFSTETETAVKAFQQVNKLSVTGVINQKTVDALQQSLVVKIKDPANDLQLKTALELLVK